MISIKVVRKLITNEDFIDNNFLFNKRISSVSMIIAIIKYKGMK